VSVQSAVIKEKSVSIQSTVTLRRRDGVCSEYSHHKKESEEDEAEQPDTPQRERVGREEKPKPPF
jgi:hypothetical protein